MEYSSALRFVLLAALNKARVDEEGLNKAMPTDKPTAVTQPTLDTHAILMQHYIKDAVKGFHKMKHRLQLDFTQQALRELDGLREATGLPNRAEVIRQALRFLQWTITETQVLDGASIGANATIVCGVTIGRFAMVAAGATVTHDVADHQLVAGTPARHLGWVDRDGNVVSAAVERPQA